LESVSGRGSEEGVTARERKTAPGRGGAEPLEWRSLERRARAIAGALAPGEPSLAEDLAQEALLKLLVQQPAPKRPVAWLRVTLRNLYTDRRRRDERRRALPIEGLAEPATAAAELPDRSLVVRQALAALSESQRTILALFSLGFSHAEIATRIDCEIHQVGPRIQRALRSARRALRDEKRDPV
jgi:RNA polymerase sigma factor (sigma-70 family)